MEDKAAEMLISMVSKGSEVTIKIAAASSKALMKLAAFIKAMWEKQTPKGKVSMAKLLKDGGPLSGIFLDKEKYRMLEKIAKKQGFTYNSLYNENMNGYMVTLKSSDVDRLRTVFDFYSMSADDLRREAYAEKPKDTAEQGYTDVEKDVKIEDVDKDEVAKYDMDEQNERENFDLEKEIERKSMTKEEFDRRKEEILDNNENSIDIEKWNEQSDKIPHLFLAADDEVIEEAKREIRKDELGEANAVSKLRESNIKEMNISKSDIKIQEVEISR